MNCRSETAWRGYITNVTEVTTYRFYIHQEFGGQQVLLST